MIIQAMWLSTGTSYTIMTSQIYIKLILTTLYYLYELESPHFYLVLIKIIIQGLSISNTTAIQDSLPCICMGYKLLI